MTLDINIQQRIDEVMNQLPPNPEELGADRKYLLPYIQHIPSEINRIQRQFLDICFDVLKSDIYKSEHITRQGVIGRYLDDSGNKPLYTCWYRFMCIDEKYREWLQPYYAINHSQYKIEECSKINDKYPELTSYFRNLKIDIFFEMSQTPDN